MKYLVHLSFPYYTYHALIILNEAERLIEEGNEVEVLACGGGVDRCYANITGDKNMCNTCISMQKKWLGMLTKKHKARYYAEYMSSPQSNADFEYSNAEDITKIVYKAVKIGYGAYSSYVSKTKNLNPRIDKDFKSFFNKVLNVQCTLTDMLENYINIERPDAVLMFSARHFEVRPFYDLPTQLKLRVECLEAGFSLEKDKYMGYNYGKYQPHSIEYHHSLILKLWNESVLEDKFKIARGEEFFQKKRNNIFTGGLVYTEGQKTGALPTNWDYKKRNFVIFNSSEDEFVAVGDEYSKKALFQNQFVGITAILEQIKGRTDIHIYIRVHPAQKLVQYKYHLDLYNLSEKYANVTVIHATDVISSYALIDSAEKIIVFGSTIGIEAVYWNKPVILLAGALYYYLDQCYIPTNVTQLKQLLDDYLVPRKSIDAIKFGFYMMTERGYPLKSIGFKRVKWLPFNPMKINRESLLDMIVRFIRLRKFSKLEVATVKDIPCIEA